MGLVGTSRIHTFDLVTLKVIWVIGCICDFSLFGPHYRRLKTFLVDNKAKR